MSGITLSFVARYLTHFVQNGSHDSPIAFHAVLGVALFLFGNLISQNSTLAISREPTAPDFYWRAALDVFDAGDNIPHHSVTGDYGPDHPDDWRLPITWGRTLVALASNPNPSPPPSPLSPSSSPPRHRVAPRSPLAAIAAMRTPGFLAHPAHASPHELLTLAADQFSRGIFHMPHGVGGSHDAHGPTWARPTSRLQELFTLASEVLRVAERLDAPDERRKWAMWADAIFHQMHMEADVDAWRARVVAARGRCWLAVGSAHADELEAALERGDRSVLGSREAEDARAALRSGESCCAVSGMCVLTFWDQRYPPLIAQRDLHRPSPRRPPSQTCSLW